MRVARFESSGPGSCRRPRFLLAESGTGAAIIESAFNGEPADSGFNLKFRRPEWAVAGISAPVPAGPRAELHTSPTGLLGTERQHMRNITVLAVQDAELVH